MRGFTAVYEYSYILVKFVLMLLNFRLSKGDINDCNKMENASKVNNEGIWF